MTDRPLLNEAAAATKVAISITSRGSSVPACSCVYFNKFNACRQNVRSLVSGRINAGPYCRLVDGTRQKRVIIRLLRETLRKAHARVRLQWNRARARASAHSIRAILISLTRRADESLFTARPAPPALHLKSARTRATIFASDARWIKKNICTPRILFGTKIYTKRTDILQSVFPRVSNRVFTCIDATGADTAATFFRVKLIKTGMCVYVCGGRQGR